MGYVGVGTTAAQQRTAAADAARRRAQAAAMASLANPATAALPGCIPERYRQAAANWCVERQTVSGLGTTDWDLPQEYLSDPCAAKDLPPCPANDEPTLTAPVLSTSSAPSVDRVPAAPPPPPPAPELATVKPNYLMWGVVGGVGLLALLVWRASK